MLRLIFFTVLSHFHLVIETIDRLPQTGDNETYPKQRLLDKPIEHKHCIDEHGEYLPEIWNWTPGRYQRKQSRVDRARAKENFHYANNHE
jgi:phosphoketolase